MWRVVDTYKALPPARPYVTRTNPISYIALHHTSGPINQPAKVIHDYHISKGWRGIGYHFLVRYPDNSGIAVIEKVRPENTIPACVTGFNSTTICVAMVGNYERNDVPDSYLEIVCKFLAHLCSTYNLDPEFAVKGHREFPRQETNCPGRNVDMDLVRRLVRRFKRTIRTERR
ncbi:MAG: peptidoglycan recognition protein family protein [Acidilobaceae archaeon]|nr:peptidoglycan recognition protein family protein [Acidilobaceae archaeon]